MPSRTPPPAQQPLPLELPTPCASQVQAEAVRLCRQRPYWLNRYPSPAAVLADPLAAHVLRVCAAALLRNRQRNPPPQRG